jgi:uncharacterized RDD family membrane protein YckC/DNA-binding transcriptional ArsR family regulator
MAVDQENVSKSISVLSHRIRREILLVLHDKGETSFTDLMIGLNVDTGKLSFHIRSLSPFIEQSETGKYRLSRTGEDAVRVIRDVESWAEMTAVNRKASTLALASFKRRTYAFLIDYCIMFILTLPLLLPTLLPVLVGNWIIGILNLLFVTLAPLWGYSTILEGFIGQTIGKRALGLMAIRADGKKIDYEHSAVRNLGKVLLPFDLLFGYMLKDPRYIRYFDKFAGTTVIDLRQKTKPLENVNAKATQNP